MSGSYKIMLITPFYYPFIVGGAEISVQCLAEGLSKKNYDVTVLTYDKKSSVEWINHVKVIRRSDTVFPNIWESSFENNVKHSYLEKIINYLCRLFPVRNIVKEYCGIFEVEKPDIVIMNSNEEYMSRPSLWKALYSKKIKNILTLRDPMLLKFSVGKVNIDWLFQKIIKKQLNWLRWYAAPSRFMLDSYKAIYCDRIKDSKVIYNAVDMALEVPDYLHKEKMFLYAGNLRREKGVLTLVEAFTKARERLKDYKLVLIGRGELEKQLAAVPNVTVIPWMDRRELYNHMKRAKCVVLPSEWPEAFGRTIIESVYNGTIPIGSDYAAIPEVLQNKNLRFKMADSVQLAQKLEMVAGLDERNYSIIIESLQKDFYKFSAAEYANNWERYILDIVEGE